MRDPTAAAVDAAAVRRFLTFRSAGNLYALPAEDVLEVIHVPAVARVPQSPASVARPREPARHGPAARRPAGAARLDRRVGRRRSQPRPSCSMPEPRSRLAVDSVDSLVAIAEDRIEVRESELSARPGELLRGAFRSSSSDDVAKILDIKRLLGAAFRSSTRGRRDRRARRAAAEPTQRPATIASAAVDARHVRGRGTGIRSRARLRAGNPARARRRRGRAARRGARPRRDVVARPPAAAAVAARAARLSARAGCGWARESRRHENRRRAGGARRGPRASHLGRAGRRASTRFRRCSRRAPAAKRASKPSIAASKAAG